MQFYRQRDITIVQIATLSVHVQPCFLTSLRGRGSASAHLDGDNKQGKTSKESSNRLNKTNYRAESSNCLLTEYNDRLAIRPIMLYLASFVENVHYSFISDFMNKIVFNTFCVLSGLARVLPVSIHFQLISLKIRPLACIQVKYQGL